MEEVGVGVDTNIFNLIRYLVLAISTSLLWPAIARRFLEYFAYRSLHKNGLLYMPRITSLFSRRSGGSVRIPFTYTLGGVVVLLAYLFSITFDIALELGSGSRVVIVSEDVEVATWNSFESLESARGRYSSILWGLAVERVHNLAGVCYRLQDGLLHYHPILPNTVNTTDGITIVGLWCPGNKTEAERIGDPNEIGLRCDSEGGRPRCARASFDPENVSFNSPFTILDHRPMSSNVTSFTTILSQVEVVLDVQGTNISCVRNVRYNAEGTAEVHSNVLGCYRISENETEVLQISITSENRAEFTREFRSPIADALIGLDIVVSSASRSDFTMENGLFVILASFFALPRAMTDTFATRMTSVPVRSKTEATVKVWALWLFGSTLVTLIVAYWLMWYLLKDDGIYKVERAFGRWLEEKTAQTDSAQAEPEVVLRVEKHIGRNRFTVSHRDT